MSGEKTGVLELVQPSPKKGIAEVLQPFLEANERGEVLGICIVAELTGHRTSSAFSTDDLWRMVGAIERVKYCLVKDGSGG